jgi:hypothetical protein
MNELLTLGHVRAMELLEALDVSEMRMSDAIQVTRLYMDYLKAFPVQPEPSSDDDWTEEDDAELERIAKRVRARRNSGEGAQAPDERESVSDDSGEVHSGESEGDET